MIYGNIVRWSELPFDNWKPYTYIRTNTKKKYTPTEHVVYLQNYDNFLSLIHSWNRTAQQYSSGWTYESKGE